MRGAYSVQLPEVDAVWGCSATSIGCARVSLATPAQGKIRGGASGAAAAGGRILQACRLVWISEGHGELESGPAKRKHEIKTGDVFVVLPAIWHRYGPIRGREWTENWLDLRGPAIDSAVHRAIDHARPVVRTEPGIIDCFERCHALGRTDALQNRALISTLGLHLFALFCRAQAAGKTSAISAVVSQAQMLMLQRCADPLNVEALADELQVGYSYFRKTFRDETGISPKQFHLQARLNKAQDFLANTNKSLIQIAKLLGFNSPFHLSAQFKEAVGVSPREWRSRTTAQRKR